MASSSISKPSSVPETRRCHNRWEVGYLVRNCRKPRTESCGHPIVPSGGLKQIQTNDPDHAHSVQPESTDVCTIRIDDRGSMPQCIPVQLQGVPVYGVIDTGADITILGGKLFKRVGTTSKLRRRDFRPADKTLETTTYTHSSWTGVYSLLSFQCGTLAQREMPRTAAPTSKASSAYCLRESCLISSPTATPEQDGGSPADSCYKSQPASLGGASTCSIVL